MFPAFAHFRRTATCDTELHGQKIREGEKVVMWYVSSNRDETRYEDPDRFDVRAQPRAPGLRRRRPALLPRHRARPPRAAGDARGDARALSRRCASTGTPRVRGIAVPQPAQDPSRQAASLAAHRAPAPLVRRRGRSRPRRRGPSGRSRRGRFRGGERRGRPAGLAPAAAPVAGCGSAAVRGDQRRPRRDGVLPLHARSEESTSLAERIDGGIAARGYGLWAVELPGEAPFIGFVGLDDVDPGLPFAPRWSSGGGWRARTGAAGWHTRRPGWRRAAAWISGSRRSCSYTAAINLRSRRLMERLGMRRDPGEDFLHPGIPTGQSPIGPRPLPTRRARWIRARARWPAHGCLAPCRC